MKPIFWFLPLFVLVLSGCSLPQGLGGKPTRTGLDAAVLKSTDGGLTYEAKSAAKSSDSKLNQNMLSGAETLSLAIDPSDPNKLYLGTRNDGVFLTKDGGNEWQRLEYPPLKVYGLAVDPKNGNRIYASGEWQGSGQLYRSDDGGQKWDRIYTEPAQGSIIISLAIDPTRDGTLYAGISSGVVVKTTDAGATWSNIKNTAFQLPAAGQGNPANNIVLDAQDPDTLYISYINRGLFKSRDGGLTFTELKAVPPKVGTQATYVNSRETFYTLVADPSRGGTLYAANKAGLLRSRDYGDTWELMNIIESSKKFPIRALAVNPKQSDEIVYSSALALYKTTDGGAHWYTYPVESKNQVGVIHYDPSNPNILYLGTRSFGN